MLKKRLKRVDKAVSIINRSNMRYFVCFKDPSVDLIKVTDGYSVLFEGNNEDYLKFKESLGGGTFINFSIPRPK